MEVEIDGELLTVGSEDSLGYYGLLFLAIWRNSVGKLGFPGYDHIAEQKSSFWKYANIGIIWIIYWI